MDDCEGCVAEVSAAAARAARSTGRATKEPKYCHLCLEAIWRGQPLPNTNRAPKPYRRPPTSYRSHGPSPLSSVTDANTNGTIGGTKKRSPRKRRDTLPSKPSFLPPKPSSLPPSSSLPGRPPPPLTSPNNIPIPPRRQRNSLPPSLADFPDLATTNPVAASLLARLGPVPVPERGERGERRRSPKRDSGVGPARPPKRNWR